MRRNMFSVIILVVCLANFAMTAVILFSVLTSTKNTNDLVYKVAQAIDLQLESEDEADGLSIYDTETYELATKEITLNLKKAEGASKDNYAVISGVSLVLDTTASDYEKASAKIKESEVKLSDIIISVYETYEKDAAQENKDEIKQKIMKDINEKFETEIVVDISFVIAFQ